MLVIHPALSAWGMQVSGDFEDENRKAYRDLEDKFAWLYSFLIRNSIDFDYGDELVMEECAQVKGFASKTTLKVGECKYKTVVVYGLETIRSSTLKLLSLFANRGGKVIFIDGLPARVDGFITKISALGFIKRCVMAKKEDKNLSSIIAPRSFIRVDEYGSEKNVCFRKRVFADGTVLLHALNLNREQPIEAIIKIEGDFRAQRIDVRTGIVDTFRAVRENGYTIIPHLFNEGCELVLVLNEIEKSRLYEEKVEKPREEPIFEKEPFANSFEYKLSEPNVVVLETAQFVINGEGRGEFDIFNIDKMIRKEFKLCDRDGIQPYFKKGVLGLSTDAVIADAELRFRFAVKNKPNKLQLVLEEPERFIINVNGRRLPITKVGNWVDKCFEKIALPTTYLIEGENVISLSFKLSEESPIEPIYLVGDFGVKQVKTDTYEVNEIIKLPEKVFSEGVTTSIFIFEAGIPQNKREIFACYIEDDGLETVKNQGRQDIKDRWQSIEDSWIEIIRKHSGSDTIQWLKPAEFLSYQVPKKEFEVSDEDFMKTIMNYIMFQSGVDAKELETVLVSKVMYSSKITKSEDNSVAIQIEGSGDANG